MTDLAEGRGGRVLATTERLVLRAAAPDDANALLRMHTAPEVTAILPRLPTTLEEQHAEVARWASAVVEGDYGWWVLEPRDGSDVVGAVLFVPCRDVDTTEVGWRLDPAAWGHGYATEAAAAVLAHAWANTDLPHVDALVLPTNTRSAAVARRLGMTPAGQVVHADLVHDVYRAHRPAAV